NARNFDRLLEDFTRLHLPWRRQFGRNRSRIGGGKCRAGDCHGQNGGEGTLHIHSYFPARSVSISCQWTTLSYSACTGSRSSLPWARLSVGTWTQAPVVP